MQILQTLTLYLYAVSGHWLFSFGGIVLVAFALYEKYLHKITPSRWFWGLAALCIFVATFQAWSDEHEKRKEDAVYLIPEEPLLVPGGVPNAPVWFSVGKPPQVGILWGVFGKSPALHIRIDVACYIEDDTAPSFQESTINKFVEEWANLKVIPGAEYPNLFPGGHRLGGTCHSEDIISEEMRSDIATGNKIVYVLSAARFNDSTGEHEAHACKWLETHLSDSKEFFGTVAWHECNNYTAQVDISRH